MAQRIEQVVRNDTDGVHACAWPENNSRTTEFNSGIIHGVEKRHVELTRVQKGLQHLWHWTEDIDNRTWMSIILYHNYGA